MPTSRDLIGKRVSFDHPDGSKRRLTGICTAADDAGINARGGIPDYRVTVRGNSGRTIELPSTVDAYLSAED